ncbi:hypothetical protein V6N13_104940 [Hibiscus sabdariffa]
METSMTYILKSLNGNGVSSETVSTSLSTSCYPEFAAEVFVATGSFSFLDMVEETRKLYMDISIGFVGLMSEIIVIVCWMTLALTMMVNYTEIEENVAYSVIFGQSGMKWDKHLVNICALKGTTRSLCFQSLGQARYITQTVRAHMIHSIVAWVHNIDIDFETELIGAWYDIVAMEISSMGMKLMRLTLVLHRIKNPMQ